MYEFLTCMIPTKTQVEYGAVAAVIGSIINYFCGWDGMAEALLMLMALDYATGLVAATVAGNLDSHKGFRGILKKVCILVIVSVAHFLDVAAGQDVFRMAVIWFYLCNEALSILENAAKSGVPLPQGLIKKLEQLKEEKVERSALK